MILPETSKEQKVPFKFGGKDLLKVSEWMSFLILLLFEDFVFHFVLLCLFFGLGRGWLLFLVSLFFFLTSPWNVSLYRWILFRVRPTSPSSVLSLEWISFCSDQCSSVLLTEALLCSWPDIGVGHPYSPYLHIRDPLSLLLWFYIRVSV